MHKNCSKSQNIMGIHVANFSSRYLEGQSMASASKNTPSVNYEQSIALENHLTFKNKSSNWMGRLHPLPYRLFNSLPCTGCSCVRSHGITNCPRGCVAFLVAHVFENHAGPVEFVRCLVNLWILILLNLHTWHLCIAAMMPKNGVGLQMMVMESNETYINIGTPEKVETSKSY